MQANYSIKDYLTKPIVAKITSQEAQLRDRMMDWIIKNHEPYTPRDLGEEKLIQVMEEKNILARDEQGDVSCIYPVSARKTNKKVVFEDGSYGYAMCAIDAIGFYYTFNRPIIIEGNCEHCDKQIKLKVENGLVKVLSGGENIHILHTDLDKMENWSCCCCNIMHFFSCPESLQQWLNERNISNKVFAIDLETGNKIAWLLFSK